jgi:hypothetical protein
MYKVLACIAVLKPVPKPKNSLLNPKKHEPDPLQVHWLGLGLKTYLHYGHPHILLGSLVVQDAMEFTRPTNANDRDRDQEEPINIRQSTPRNMLIISTFFLPL